MIQALMPHPLSPQVNIGDVIVFLTFCAVFMFALLKDGTPNGR
jgi:hypothetical protein